MGELTELARELRQRMTDAERLLWSRLRRHFLGTKFRRQVPMGDFIVDFACMGSRIVIEVDGGQHLENVADRARDQWLEANGFRWWQRSETEPGQRSESDPPPAGVEVASVAS